MTLRVRRGTNAERLTVTPQEGEPVYTTDTKKFFIGDGTTVGGIEVTDEENLPALPSSEALYELNVDSSGNGTWVETRIPIAPTNSSNSQNYELTVPVSGAPSWTLTDNLPDLPSSEETYTLNVDSSGDGTWIIDPNSNIPNAPAATSENTNYELTIPASGNPSWTLTDNLPDLPSVETPYVLNVDSSGDGTWAAHNIPTSPANAVTEQKYSLSVPISGNPTWTVTSGGTGLSKILSYNSIRTEPIIYVRSQNSQTKTVLLRDNYIDSIYTNTDGVISTSDSGTYKISVTGKARLTNNSFASSTRESLQLLAKNGSSGTFTLIPPANSVVSAGTLDNPDYGALSTVLDLQADSEIKLEYTVDAGGGAQLTPTFQPVNFSITIEKIG